MILVAIALSACVSPTPTPQPTPTGRAVPGLLRPATKLTISAVLDDCPAEDAVHYQGYALPVDRVYICRGDGFHNTDGISTRGPWESASLVVEPAALLAAYRLPDRRPSRGLCPDSPTDPLIVWLSHEGMTTAYYAPVDGCGDPSAASRDAYNSAKRDVLIDIDLGGLAKIDQGHPHMTDREDQ